MSETNAPSGPSRALVLTIHGTNDGVHGGPGDTKWWETSSDFIRELKTRLAARGLQVDVEEFLWGGANSAFARQKGAVALRRRLRKQAKAYDEIHLIGHSHGGNVAVDAARRAAWGRERKGRFFRGKPANLTSLTTVGTPFLRPFARSSDYIYALASVVLMLLATFAFAAAPANTLWNIARMALGADPVARLNDQLIVAGISLLLAVPPALLLVQRWSRFRWIAQLMKRGARRANLLSIWHAKDEAIGGLMRADLFNPELVPRGALWSSGHRFGAKLGSAVFVVFGILIIPLIAILLAFGAQQVPLLGQVQIPNIVGGNAQGQSLNVAIFIIMSLAGIGALALGLYLAARLVVFGAAELVARRSINRSAVGALRNFAFGADTGQKLGDVSERPHFYEGEVWIVPPALAERMEAETLSALTGFLARHRTSLFGVTVSPDWMREIGEDAATWDSLIHTTYFDHPEIADRIADHIAGAHDDPEGTEPVGDLAAAPVNAPD